MRRSLFATALSLAFQISPASASRPANAITSAAEKPLLDVKFNAKTGKLLATLPKPGADGVSARFIYITQLETGLGSAPTQLDFGAASNSRILVFRRVGKKVVADVENSKFVSSNPAEQLTTEHSFPTSRLWMGDVVKELPNGSYQTDISAFLARDDINIPRVLKNIGAGEFKFVPDLSAADPSFVKLFPRNVELAARITFRSDDPKDEMNNILPGDTTLSVVERHSLIALPEPGYVPRTDPYGYTIGQQQVDFSKPLGAPIVGDLARRFRLEKVDPSAVRSPVKADHLLHRSRHAAGDPGRGAAGSCLVDSGV